MNPLQLLCLLFHSYLQMTSGQPEEDEITWGSDELPIENMNSKVKDGKHDFLQTWVVTLQRIY